MLGSVDACWSKGESGISSRDKCVVYLYHFVASGGFFPENI